MLVLAVKGQQHLPRLAQVADRCAAAVDVRPRSTIRAYATGEHQLARVGRQALAERLARVWGEVEHSLDIGLGGPRTHDPGACAAAQEQVQRVREDRLAGSGLARDHIQARGKAQLCALDQQQVLDRELVQHPAISSNARRRIAATAPAAGPAAAAPRRRSRSAAEMTIRGVACAIEWGTDPTRCGPFDVLKPPAPHGMAASDNDPSLHSSPAAEVECLSAAALSARMSEA